MSKREILSLTAVFMLCSCVARAPCLAQDATLLYNQSRFNRAVKIYRVAANAGNYSGYLNLAVVLKDLGHYSQSIRALKAAAVKFPQDRAILALLGRLYFLNNEPRRAIPILKQVLRKYPGDVETLLTLGLCCEESGLVAEAGDFLREAITREPDNVIAHLSLADIYYRSNKLQESAQEYKTVNLLDASIQQINKCWGSILFELGNYIEAYKIYEKISAWEPENADVSARLTAIREKLGKGFFSKQKERRVVEKVKKSVLVKPARVSNGLIMARVGLVQKASAVELKLSTDYTIVTKAGGFFIWRGKAGQVCKVSISPDNKILCRIAYKDTVVADEPIVFSPVENSGTCTIFGVSAGKDDYWHNKKDRSYRGRIEVSSADGKVRIINELNLEEYLYSVVPSEMLPKWPLEALKAQAVAARSEAMSKLRRHKKDGYNFCPEVHCQSYTGVEQETAVTNLAVDETRGRVLYHNGKVVDAVYSNCCGGHTQDNVFGKGAVVEYYKGIFDGLDGRVLFPLSPVDFEMWLKTPSGNILCNIPEYARSSNFRWVRVYEAAEMNALAGKLGFAGKVSKITVIKRNASGHISALKLAGSGSSRLIEQELNIRKALGNLRSSMFKVEIKYGKDKTPERFVFYGGGWGHGVGMCQAGACGLAHKNYNFEAILKHYYAGAELKEIY
ncbi:MAG: SpoIID/LytB domain-containing protein [Candidatus Omnitrophota bacterium]